MQIINHWPTHELAVSKEVEEALCKQLLMPFSTTEKASSFWEKSGTCLVIIEQGDDESLIQTLGERLTQRISSAIDCYEYKETLTQQYQLSLSIISDDGTGLYLLIHNNNTLIPHLSG